MFVNLETAKAPPPIEIGMSQVVPEAFIFGNPHSGHTETITNCIRLGYYDYEYHIIELSCSCGDKQVVNDMLRRVF